MRKFYVFVILIFALLVSACHRGLYLTTSDNNKIYLSSLRGKWVLVSYWASWCDSCKLDIPILNDLYRTKSDDVILLGVDYLKNTGKTLQNNIHNMKIHFPVVEYGLSGLYQFPKMKSVPTLFVVNPKGALVATVYGLHTNEQLQNIMRSLRKNALHFTTSSGYYFSSMSTQLKRQH